MAKTTLNFHEGDLPDGVDLVGDLAVDTEAMGLRILHDRLCLVQIADEVGAVHLVRLDRECYNAPNLKAVLEDLERVKIFHFARFDMAMLKHYLSIMATPIYCTKIASRLARTYTDRHGLKELCRELIGVELSKHQQSSDWGNAILTQQQRDYAASDVLYLHRCRDKLNHILEREHRMHLATSSFAFLPSRIELDLAGWENEDIFAH